jgi:hypothetical protein
MENLALEFYVKKGVGLSPISVKFVLQDGEVNFQITRAMAHSLMERLLFALDTNDLHKHRDIH